MREFKLLALLFAAIGFTSCGTISNGEIFNPKFKADVPGAVAKVNDTVYNLPARIKLPPGKQDVALTLIADSITKEFVVKKGLKPRFMFGNNYSLYMYDTTSVIKPTPTVIARHFDNDGFPSKKGEVLIELPIPFANHIYIQPRNRAGGFYNGFLGVSAAVSYLYKNTKYIRLYAGIAIDFSVPFPAPVDIDGTHESVSVNNFTLTDNYKLGRFTAGYGLNYSIYQWHRSNNMYDWPPNRLPGEVEHPDDLLMPLTKNSHGIGLTFSGYYCLVKGLHFGVVYSPTFYNLFPTGAFIYQHLLNFEVVYKLNMNFFKALNLYKK